MKTQTIVNTEATRLRIASQQSTEAFPEVQAPHTFTPPYPPLALVTKPNLTTAELAYYSNLAVQTWRVKACFETFPDGLRPLRVCGKLAWPTVGAKKLLLGVV